MAEPIVNPEIPYVGEVPGGLQPGKMIRIQGVTHPHSDRFNINLSTGPNAKPRDDTALHVSVRLKQGYVARNTYKDGGWGDEQGSGKLPIGNAQSFEMILLTDPSHYKIAINGQHFCEFPHSIPFQEVSYLLIDGDVSITLLSFEGIAIPEGITATQSSEVHAPGPTGGPQFGGPQYGPPQGGYGGPPPNYGGYGPPPPPGAEPQSEFGGFMEQAQDMLAGAIKSGAAEKLLGSLLHSGSDQQQQQQQGYAHQNARYGIYPDLPTQDAAAFPPQNTGQPNEQDSALSGLIAGSGGTITSGPQHSGGNPPFAGQPPPFAGQPPPVGQNIPRTPGGTQAGPLEGLLLGLLGGKESQAGGNQQMGGSGPPQNTQSGGADLLSGLLSSLMSANKQGDRPGAQNPPQYVGAYPQNPQGGGLPPGAQGGGSDILSGILQNLLSGNKDQQAPGTQNQPPYGPQSTPNTQGGQAQGSDALSGLLSSLLSSGQNQQNAAAPNQPPQGPNQSGGDVFSSILQNLVSGSTQQTPAGQNVPTQTFNQPQNTQGQGGQNNAELITNLLQGLLNKTGEQHDNTRPVQETHPSGGGPQSPRPPQDPQQQYGQYPHPPQQDQRGPMESLLSGLISGGGGQQQQPPHVPQVGGEGSVGGLGSMGGILGSLAGSLLHRPSCKTVRELPPTCPPAPSCCPTLNPNGVPHYHAPQHPCNPQCFGGHPQPPVGDYSGPPYPYPAQPIYGMDRPWYPVQPVGYPGYPFPAPAPHGDSPKKEKCRRKGRRRGSGSGSSSSSSSDSD